MTAPRNRFALFALSLCVAMAPCAFSADIVPAKSAAESPSKAEKARIARQKGEWTVDRGESLLKICRQLSDDPGTRRAISLAILEDNPGAFIAGDRTRIMVGAKLRLRSDLVLPASATIANSHSSSAPTAAHAPASSNGGAKAIGTPPPADGRKNVVKNGRRNGSAISAAPAAEPAFRDRLIDAAAAEAEDRLEEARERDATPGLRSTSVEYRLDRRDSNAIGLSVSQGVLLQHRRETEIYGDFTLDLEIGRDNPATGDVRPASTVGKGTLYHENFAIANGIVSNTALGVTRSALAPWMSASYRVSVPSTLIAGASALITTPVTEWRASAGRLGRLAGTAIQDFEYTSGSMAGLSMGARLTSDWIVGAGLASVKGSDLVRDSTAITLATEFALPGRGATFKLQAMADDDNRKGLWADGQYRDGRLSHKFGAYQIDPDLVFGEAVPQRDIRGLYWRGDYRAGVDFASFSVEASETNIDRDPTRGGSAGVGGTATFTLKIDRTMSVGAGASLRNERPRTMVGEDRRTGYFNAFVSKNTAWGMTRFDATANLTRPEGGRDERISMVSWSQDWPRLASMDVNSLVTVSHENLAERIVRRTSASAGVRGPLLENLRWDATMMAVDVDDGDNSERNYNAYVGLDWTPVPRWLVRLQWQRNQVQPAADNPLSPFVRENIVQLAVRYEDFQGTPYPGVGTAGGRSGTGRITGVIFFDENGDGVRQPTERGAGGVMVVLDGRRAETTDADGRFTFPLVTTGEHRITVNVEKLPLPWGLEDDAPRTVRVDLREDARLDVGFKRIGP